MDDLPEIPKYKKKAKPKKYIIYCTSEPITTKKDENCIWRKWRTYESLNAAKTALDKYNKDLKNGRWYHIITRFKLEEIS